MGSPARRDESSFLERVRGLTVFAYGASSMVAFFLAQLPSMALTGTGDFSIWLARHAWAPSALRLAGVRVEVDAPHGVPGGPAIYASNHESALDVWVLFRAIPRNLRFIAKQELFQIPIFGWYLTLAKFIPVDRGNHARAVAALKEAGRIIRDGTSIVAFPEGTRSPDARVHAFKKGPFVVAMEAGVPVVPVAISGAAALNPKGRLVVRPGTIRVGVGQAVQPRDFPDKTALLRAVRAQVLDIHRRLGGRGGDPDPEVAPEGAGTGG